MYFVETLCFCKVRHMTFLVTLSYVNKDHMHVFLLLLASPYHKTKLVFSDVGYSSQAIFNDPFP
jgi:hypothetical protein